MSADSEWYRDQALLLSLIEETDWSVKAVPAIPGYEDLREVRRGGQGIVYSATQVSAKRQVAIKVLLQGTWATRRQRQRFQREIDLVAGLRHPHIVRLYDGGVTDDGCPYYVMEFIDGVGLDELLAAVTGGENWVLSGYEKLVLAPEEPSQRAATFSFDLRVSFDLMAKVADAVGYAHDRGIVHRDLKPSNIRIDNNGEPHVLDFGLAKEQRPPGFADAVPTRLSAQVSMTGEFMGSLPWASPEQTEGTPRSIDARTDVYSFGVILHQMLTGQFPYPVVGGLHDVLARIKYTEPARPGTLRKDADDEIDTIVLKCLAKEPGRRYRDCGTLARDIQHYLAGEPIEAIRDSVTYRLRKRIGRHRVSFALAAALVVVGAIGAVGTLTARRGGELRATAIENGIGDAVGADVMDQDSVCRVHEIAKLRPSDIVADDRFGWSVAVDGDTAIIGAPGKDDDWANSGSAYVYRYDGASWIREVKLLAGEGERHNMFGRAVAIHGGTAMAAAAFSREPQGKVVRYDTADVFTDAASWEAYDPREAGVGEQAREYGDALFDGRYVYFLPCRGLSDALHAEILRYDTGGNFGSANSWTAFDPRDHDVGNDISVYNDAGFDGRYVYFAGGGTYALLRHDTQGRFDDPRSWTTFNPSANGVGAAKGYGSVVFRRPYVYFGQGSGQVLRYDTDGGFHDARSWQGSNPTAVGLDEHRESFRSAVLAGRYIYFLPAPAGGPRGFPREVLRYDTTGELDDIASWTTYAYAKKVDCEEDPDCQESNAFMEAVFDGRYVYFCPDCKNSAVRCGVLRYDTFGVFTSPDSWTTFDPADHGVSSVRRSYWGGAFDGRYVFFVPHGLMGGLYGEVLRYDTAGAFTDARSWSACCAGDPGAGLDFHMHSDAAFDGRYLYLAPFTTMNRDVVYVYRRDGSEWVHDAKLQSPKYAFHDHFGSGLDLDAEALVVGAFEGYDSGDPGTGSAYVFRRNDGGTPDDPDENMWLRQATLLPSEAVAGQMFGGAAALAGDVSVITSRSCLAGEHACEFDLRGAAYVFRRHHMVAGAPGSTGGWIEEARLLSSDGEPGDGFGISLAIDGDPAQRLVVGAKYDNEQGEKAGAAYVFRFDGETWVEEAKLVASDGTEGAQFGISVAIEGDIILVGAYADGESGYFAGAAYVYRFDGTSWMEKAKLLASDGRPNDNFGKDVSLVGGTAVVGASGWDGRNIGSAYVFRGFSDCNANGELDLCDTARGNSKDRNGNGLPDECEPFPRKVSLNTTEQADENLIGPPDNRWCELGAGGVVQFDFGDSRVVDAEGYDLNVYEFDSGRVEFDLIDVQVSDDGESFVSLAPSDEPAVRINGDGIRGVVSAMSIRSYDLAGTGLSRVRYVRVVGIGDGYGKDGIGFELDTIGAIHWLSSGGD